jgi:ABC-2 type transport system permease protein
MLNAQRLTLNAYGAVLGARFRTLLQYRAAAVAGFGTQLFWGLIRMMIFAGFYHSTTAPQPMTYPQVVTYVWLGQAMFAMLIFGVDKDVQAMVRTGTVAYELLRPLDLYNLWYARAIALRTAPTLLRAVPMFLFAGLFFGLAPPPSLASGAAWIATTIGALLLGCAFWTLITITMLWTVSGEGIVRLAPAFVYVLSGQLLPIPLFPHWAQVALGFLPFRGLIDVPFRMYMGHIPPGQLGVQLGQQLAWTVALILLGRRLLARGLRRLEVQGG